MFIKGCPANFVHTECPTNFIQNKFDVIISCVILRSIQFLFLSSSIDSKKSINAHFADVANVDADILKHSKLC